MDLTRAEGGHTGGEAEGCGGQQLGSEQGVTLSEVKKLDPRQLSLTRGGEDVVPVGEPDALLGGGGGGDGGHGDGAVHAVGGAHHAPAPRSRLALQIQQG